MLVAIERNKFTYLYKYNQVRVDINQILDVSIDKLQSMVKTDFSLLLNYFDKIMPVFEQEHEVLLLDVERHKLLIQNGIVLLFEGINTIYPLTKVGSQLIEGRINSDFKVGPPVFEIIIEALQLLRSMQHRGIAASKLLSIYSLNDKVTNEDVNLVYTSVEKNILDRKKSQNLNTYLDHLIAYNKTPSFIPDGNIENICKIGAIAIKYLGKQEDVFTNGPFYKACLTYKNQINTSSFSDSYKAFISISDDNLKSSLGKVIEIISKDFKDVDIFKASYFFLAFKTYLNRNDNNLSGLTNEINRLVKDDENVAAFVLTMLGYTFSFENIYDSIHVLSNANIYKSSSENRYREPKIESVLPVEKELKIEGTNISSPITIYENTSSVENTSPLKKEEEKATASEAVPNYEKAQSPNEKSLQDNINNQKGIDSISTSFKAQEETVHETHEEEALTVKKFRVWLESNQSKPKKKIWTQFLDAYFNVSSDSISLEKLIDKLDGFPDVKDKLLKTKKDKEIIKSFFEASKY